MEIRKIVHISPFKKNRLHRIDYFQWHGATPVVWTRLPSTQFLNKALTWKSIVVRSTKC